jgi:hypothetical protein
MKAAILLFPGINPMREKTAHLRQYRRRKRNAVANSSFLMVSCYLASGLNGVLWAGNFRDAMIEQA